MRLLTPSIYLTDYALHPNQERMLLNSVNAMSAFAYNTAGTQSLPLSTYLSIFNQYHVFLGAVHMEQDPFSPLVSIHPMLLERNREAFTQATEAAILWALNTHMVPTAAVLDSVEYAYMHRFLEQLGLFQRKDNGWRKYQLPHNWSPKSFASYTFQWR